MINTSIRRIDNIPKINRKFLSLIPRQNRIIPRNVLLDSPNNPRRSRLGRTAAEKLDPAEPDSEDPVELGSSASGSPFEDDSGEFG